MTYCQTYRTYIENVNTIGRAVSEELGDKNCHENFIEKRGVVFEEWAAWVGLPNPQCTRCKGHANLITINREYNIRDQVRGYMHRRKESRQAHIPCAPYTQAT